MVFSVPAAALRKPVERAHQHAFVPRPPNAIDVRELLPRRRLVNLQNGHRRLRSDGELVDADNHLPVASTSC